MGQGTIRTPPSVALLRLCFYSLVAFALFAGWKMRNENIFIAEHGPGYALGIIGGMMMLALLLYPLRKKARFMRNMGPIRHWFRAHMVLGILGPLFVLYHANFKFGSLNSNVALVCMISVALSGLAGRYLYTRVHYGLYGPRMSLEKLKRNVEKTARSLLESELISEQIYRRYSRLEEQAFAPATSVFQTVGRIINLELSGRLANIQLLAAVRNKLAGSPASTRRAAYKEVKQNCRLHLFFLRRIAGLTFFERLLSLWHVLHYPLFFMLVISGLVHVLAVHMY